MGPIIATLIILGITATTALLIYKLIGMYMFKEQYRATKLAKKIRPGNIYIFDRKAPNPFDSAETCIIMIIKRQGEWVRYREIFDDKKYRERDVLATDLAIIINESYQ